MSIIDGLIRGMKFNSDAEDEDDMDEDDIYDDEYDQPKQRKTIGFPRRQRNNDDDEDDYDDDTRSQDRNDNGRARLLGGNGSQRPQSNPGTAPAPVPQQRRRAPQQGQSNMQVRVIKPSSFEQARLITDTLLSHRTVLLNLEGLDVNTAQRIVDFASGSCYALHGNFMKISHFIIVITPEEVDIAGDISLDGSQDGTGAGAMAMGAMTGAASGMANQNTQQYNAYGSMPRYGQN